jgi:tight adherence protein B
VTPIAIVLAVVAAVAIVLIAYALSRAGGGSGVAARLERYASTGRRKEAKPDAPNASLSDMFSQSEAMSSINRAVEGRSFGADIARDLARADLKLKPSEYLLIMAGSTLGIPLLLYLVSIFLPQLGNPLFLLIGAFVGFLLPRFYVGRRKKGRVSAFNKQLPDTITLIANALRAGSSFSRRSSSSCGRRGLRSPPSSRA